MKIFAFWTVPDSLPKKCGVFVVLSYAVKNKNEPNVLTKSVIGKAIKLHEQFPKAKLILSTGDNQGLGKTNAAVMAEYAERLGLSSSKMILEDRSLNTYENLLFSRRIVNARKFINPTIVAHDLHMRRALATVRKMNWKKTYWVSAYSRGGESYGTKRFQTYSRFTVFIYEALAMGYSKLAGWV